MLREDNCFSPSSGTQPPAPVIISLTLSFPSHPLTFPGPIDAWTIHGLWPDRCDGTYEASCDASREYTNITAILNSYGNTDLLSYMDTNWKDYQGNDESFWEHEWGKHGTCISTLETSCYDNYTPQAEVVDYFEKAVELNKGLDSYKVNRSKSCKQSTSAKYCFRRSLPTPALFPLPVPHTH
jgi:ribonuclease T2